MATTLYTVAYENSIGVTHTYIEPTTEDEANIHLAKFKARYCNEDGSPRPWPTGKGHYDYTNPRVMRITLF